MQLKKEGKYDNIRKVVRYLLSVNFAEIFLILSAIITRLPLPLLPLQILWINLLTDGLPALALSADPYDKEIMKRKPRGKKEGILHKMLFFILGSAIITLILSMSIFLFALFAFDLNKARTMVFTFIVMFELFFVFNCRSEKYSVFKIGFRGNKKLLLAVLISIFLQLAAIYIPILQLVFRTVSLGLYDWALILLLSMSAFLILPKIFIKKS